MDYWETINDIIDIPAFMTERDRIWRDSPRFADADLAEETLRQKMLPIVEGWRYGDAPKSGYSWNQMDGRGEAGMSLMGLRDMEPVRTVATIMLDFIEQRPVRWFRGRLQPTTGAEGEPLIRDFKRIPATGAAK